MDEGPIPASIKKAGLASDVGPTQQPCGPQGGDSLVFESTAFRDSVQTGDGCGLQWQDGRSEEQGWKERLHRWKRLETGDNFHWIERMIRGDAPFRRRRPGGSGVSGLIDDTHKCRRPGFATVTGSRTFCSSASVRRQDIPDISPFLMAVTPQDKTDPLDYLFHFRFKSQYSAQPMLPVFLSRSPIRGWVQAVRVILFWLVPVGGVPAQLSDPVVQIWQTEHGLPQNTVTAVLRTADGYCWIGTQHGLARFDGIRFVVFNSSNTPAFKSDRVSALAQDSVGNLWIGTAGGGVLRLANAAFTHFSVGDGLASDMVTCLSAGQEGTVWVGTVYGLNHFRMGKFSTLRTREGLPGVEILSLAPDGSGGLWIGTNQGPAQWSGGRMTAHPWQMPVDGLARAGEGSMWVSGRFFGLLEGEVSRTSRMRQVLPMGRVTALASGQQGEAWAAMEDGTLWRTRNEMRELIRAALPAGGIRTLHCDAEGNVWAGLNGGGLARLKERQLSPVPTPEALPDQVLAMAVDESGDIWAGGNTGELLLYRNDRFQAVDAGKNFASKGPILTLCPGRDGDLWIGKRGGGLYRWNRGNITVPGTAGKSIAAVITALFMDPSGSLWIGTEAEGILCYKNQQFRRYTRRDGFSSDQATGIVRQPDGALWFGTAGSGMNCMKEGKVRTFGTPEGLASEAIKTVFVDRAGWLWVGTSAGLSVWQNGHFFSFDAKHGLSPDVVSQLGEDDAGHLWMGSNRGLLRVPRNDLVEAVQGTRERVMAIPFGTADGMPSPECPGGRQNSSVKDSAGRLWFTTLRGPVMVHLPKPEKVPVSGPSALVERVLVNEEVALADPLTFGNAERSRISVPPGPAKVAFQFTAPSLRAPEKIDFRYRMVGMDTRWSYDGKERAAVYSRLPPGDYQFEVEATNGDGQWAGHTLGLTVHPHYWQTLWFKGVMAAAVAFAAGSLWYLRAVRRRELELVRLRIAGDLHDELGSNLAGIALLSRRLERQSVMGERERSEIHEISRIAVQTTEAARDIVWFINPSCDSLSELFLRMKEVAAVLLSNVAYTFEVPDHAGPGQLPPGFRRNLFLTFKEVLHNLVRHSGATAVEIKVRESGRQVSISVRDNGCGFDLERNPHNGGLKNAQLRLRSLHGELRIESQPGEGTVIQFSAPLP